MEVTQNKLYKHAYLLALFTIFYNLIEGVVSMALGYSDETIALFGFGVDSFIEVLSGVGIAVMIKRIGSGNNIKDPAGCSSQTGQFEEQALKVTGTAFYLLSAGLAAGIVVNLVNGHKPETTLWGIVISVISIAVMYRLMASKKRTGKALSSDPIIADANCTKVCIYMSAVLLLSSLVYEFTGFAYADVIGAAGLIWFSVSEGREAFGKARGKACNCSH